MTTVPPQIRPFHFPTDLLVGSRTRLTCEAREGDIPLTFHWQLEGKELLPDIMVTSMDSFSSTLSISMVREEHGGNYICTVQNTGGSDHHSAVLIVNGKYPPHLPA